MRARVRSLLERLRMLSPLIDPLDDAAMQRMFNTVYGPPSKNGAPVLTTGAPSRTAEPLEGHTAMNIISVRDLHRGHIITQHPDHPGQTVAYLVERCSFIERRDVPCVQIDYTSPAPPLPGHRANGPAQGRTILPAGAQVGVSTQTERAA